MFSSQGSRVKAAVALSTALFASTASASITTFDNGATNGWGVFFANNGTQGDFIEQTGGQPGAHLRFTMQEMFGVSLINTTNSAVLGDYGKFTNGVTIGLDVKADLIKQSDTGFDRERNLILELIDLNPEGSAYPWVSVWTNLGVIAGDIDWQRLETTIVNPLATALPAGWGGTGAENEFNEPILPANRTFASVLASVDRIRFTTFEPGYNYGFTDFVIRYDNISVTPVPEPATLLALAPAMLLLRRRRKG